MEKEDPNALVEVFTPDYVTLIASELENLKREMSAGDELASAAHANQIARYATALSFEMRAKLMEKSR